MNLFWTVVMMLAVAVVLIRQAVKEARRDPSAREAREAECETVERSSTQMSGLCVFELDPLVVAQRDHPFVGGELRVNHPRDGVPSFWVQEHVRYGLVLYDPGIRGGAPGTVRLFLAEAPGGVRIDQLPRDEVADPAFYRTVDAATYDTVVRTYQRLLEQRVRSAPARVTRVAADKKKRYDTSYLSMEDWSGPPW